MTIQIEEERGEKVLYISREANIVFIEDEHGVCLSIPYNEMGKLIEALNKVK